MEQPIVLLGQRVVKEMCDGVVDFCKDRLFKRTGERSGDEPVSRVMKEIGLSEQLVEQMGGFLSLQILGGTVEEL